MYPSDHRLLESAGKALRAARAAGVEPGGAAALQGVNLVLEELSLRTDATWFATHRAEAELLIEEGRTMHAGTQESGESAVPFPIDDQPSRLDALRGTLSRLVTALAPGESRDDSIKDYLARVVDWENQLYARRAQRGNAAQPSESPAAVFTVEAIARYLNGRFPDWRHLRVSDLRVVGGGFSKTTVMFDVEAEQRLRRTLVIRAETADSLLFYDGAEIDNEYQVLRLLHRAGKKVAEPLWLESDAGHFGVRFLVSARAVGKNFGTAIEVKESLSAILLHDLVSNLHAIHQTRIEADDESVRDSHLARWRQYRTLTESTTQNVEYWKSNIALLRLPPSPIIARALGWLSSHIPVCHETPCLIHRDYGLHNILIEDERIACVLDWENATLGDPAEDVAWLINGLAGTVERQTLIDLYTDSCGRSIAEERLRFFDVFNSLKYAVTCLHALTLFERNRDAPLSLCEVGLLFMHHGTKRLNASIAMATQTTSSDVRPGERLESNR